MLLMNLGLKSWMSRKVFAEQHNFESISGHQVVKSYLDRALDSERLPHALLFHGPGGLGKLSMAYALIKRISCLLDAPAGCVCNMCRKISEGKFADVMLVEPRGATGTITLNGWRPGKDDPENLQYYRFVETRPLEGSRKVLILRHAERMNTALANYILKLMEEPPPFLTLILVSNRKSELLPTIRSRCASVKFNPLSLIEMNSFVEKRELNSTALDVASAIRQSEGRPGQLDEKLASSAEEDQRDLASAMLSFNKLGFVSLFRVASDLIALGENTGADAGSKFELSLQKMSTWFRDALLVKLNADDNGRLLEFPALRNDLRDFGSGMSSESLINATEVIGRYQCFTRRQTDKNYALECLLMEVGRTIRS